MLSHERPSHERPNVPSTGTGRDRAGTGQGYWTVTGPVHPAGTGPGYRTVTGPVHPAGTGPGYRTVTGSVS
ncbi:hypothetical protein ACFZDG_01920 [Kitasatospora xanthocidica]|uniref:hypothetical protein n=1 Tax=Kitasatospora xanthocidica TaxID=83382 RepID=UPI0036E1228E